MFPLIQVAVVANLDPGGAGPVLWSAAATACYLPLYVRHIVHAVRGERSAGDRWTLAAMVVVIVGVVPLAGTPWLPSFHALVVSALLVLRRPWSVVAVAGVAVSELVLVLALDAHLPAAGAYQLVTLVWRSASVFVPLWLLGASRQLQATRRALAEEAVVREQMRIDTELRGSLGRALGEIVERGERAVTHVDRDARSDGDGDAGGYGDRAAVGGELRVLVDGSRRALAEARRMIGGYLPGSLRAELDTAVTLLSAAGVRVHVVLPQEPLPEQTDDALRAAVRAETARLLREEATQVQLVVTRCAGRLRLVVRREDDGSGPGGGPGGRASWGEVAS